MSTEFINDQWRLPNAWNGTESNVNKQSNYSMDFDGGSYIDVEHLNLTGAFSLSFWANYTTTGNGINIISQNQTGQATFGMYQLTDGKIRFWVTSSGSYNASNEITANTATNNGNWNNIILINDGTNLKIYINGSLDNSSSNGVSSPYNGTANFWIGGSQAGGAKFEGKLDGVAIFNYALTDGTGGTVNQIAALYGSSSTGIGNPMTLNPVAYYPLGDQDAFNGANYLVPNASLQDFVFNGGASSSFVFNSNINQANTGGKFTVSFWAKNSTNQQVSFSHGGNYVGAFEQVIGQMIVWLAGSVYQYFSYPTPNPRTDGKWHHYVVYVDTNTVTDSEVWIDKVQMTKGSGSNGTINAFTSGFIFKPFLGDVSNMMYFTNYEINQTNVDVLYNNGFPITSTLGLSTAPDHWWKLNASDTYDSSTGNWTIEDHAGSNDGTSSGMTQSALQQSDLSFTSGYSPYALSFDGTNEKIAYTNGTIDLGLSSTETWWMKYFNTSRNASALATAPVGAGFHILYEKNTNYIYYRIDTAVTLYYYWVIPSTYFSDNLWHHYAIVRDDSLPFSTYIKLYIDGNLFGSPTAVNATTKSTTNTKITEWGGASSYLGIVANLSNIAVWNTSLSSTEITEVFNSGVPSNLNNFSGTKPYSWWQLGSNMSYNSNWTILDEGTGNNNGDASNISEDSIVDGVGSYANGLSSGMGGDEVIGDAPYSTANSLSVNMDVEDRVTDTPS